MNGVRILPRCAAAVALVIQLAGCAVFTETYGIQQVDDWAAANEPLARSGKIKWSQFYTQYLEKVSATPVISQGPIVETLGIMVTASLFYERGHLSKADFESVQRIVRTYQTIDGAAANMLARDALVRALERDGKSPDLKSSASLR